MSLWTTNRLRLCLHASAAAFGLSAILAASATAFTAVKIIAVAYLAYLAVETLCHSGKTAAHPTSQLQSSSRLFVRQGLLSNALNPKVALFFLTFLPQFLPAHAGPGTALTFAALVAVTYVSWFSLYVAFVHHIAASLRRPRVRVALQRTTGASLAAFALRLALEHR